MPGYTNVAKPTGASYANIGKPTTSVSVVGMIRVGMITGLMIPLTYATAHSILTGADEYTNILKPT